MKTIYRYLNFGFFCFMLLFISCDPQKNIEETPEPPEPPVSEIISPQNNQTFQIGDEIVIEANATDTDGKIIEVRFSVDNKGLASVSAFPYRTSFSTKDSQPGQHKIVATAIDDLGLSNSDTLNFILEAPQIAREWTVLGYFAANNNLDQYLIKDVQEMEKAGDSDAVTSIVMLSSKKAGGVAKCYKIEKQTNHTANQIKSPVVKDDIGTADMSDPKVLKDFLLYGIENYPAKKYALIINSHGGGWTGICPEDNTNEIMRINELSSALEQVKNEKKVQFEIIVFHSCLMGMIEVAEEIRTHAKYMVASEGNMPVQSVLAADVWMANLIKDPLNKTTETLAKDIAKCVYDRSVANNKPTSMAVTDLSKIETLTSDIYDLQESLKNLNPDYWKDVVYAWNQSLLKDVEGDYRQMFRDLGLFVTKMLNPNNSILNNSMIKAALEEINKSLGEAVIQRWNPAENQIGDGLSIHFPSKQEFLYEIYYKQTRFQRDTNWDIFLKSFFANSQTAGDEQKAYFSGTVKWAGSNLSNHWNLLICHYNENNEFELKSTVEIGSSDGYYRIVTSGGEWPREYFIAAWDDKNNNSKIDAGDGFGFWDKNKNGEWDDDVLVIKANDDIQGVDIQMLTEKSGMIKSAKTNTLKFNSDQIIVNNSKEDAKF